MKNVKESQLKRCIFMVLDEYSELILNLTDGLLEVEHEVDGLYHDHTEKADNTDTYWNEDLLVTLSKHFDVEVTSVHSDCCEMPGVWICYK